MGAGERESFLEIIVVGKLPCQKFGVIITEAVNTHPTLITHKIVVRKFESKKPLVKPRGECDNKLIRK